MVMPHVIMMVIIGISASLGDARLYALGCGYLECFIDGLGLGNMEANYECVSNQVLDFFSGGRSTHPMNAGDMTVLGQGQPRWNPRRHL